MNKLELLLKNRPHWFFFICSGVFLFSAVLNFQNGHIEELPLDLGIAFVMGIIGVIVKIIWLKSLKAYETKEQEMERLELSVTTAIVVLVLDLIGILICAVILIRWHLQNRTIDIAYIDLLVTLVIVLVICVIGYARVKHQLKKLNQ